MDEKKFTDQHQDIMVRLAGQSREDAVRILMFSIVDVYVQSFRAARGVSDQQIPNADRFAASIAEHVSIGIKLELGLL